MIVETATTLFLLWCIWYLVTTYMERKSLPPGPFPYPLIGNLTYFSPNSSKPFEQVRKKYGNIFTFRFKENAVFVNTASLAREARLGRNQDKVVGLTSRTIYPFNVIFGPNDVVFDDYGTGYLFRKRLFKSAMHVFGAGIEQAEQRGGHAVNSTLQEIDSLKGQPFSPKELVSSAILIQLWQWLTSEKVSFDDPTIKLLLEFDEIVAMQSINGPLYELIPFLSYLPLKVNRSIKRALEIKSAIFLPAFQTHLETYTRGIIRDMTDSFISIYKKEIAKETGKDIGSINDIPCLMLDVAFAGSDTTSSSIAWFMLYMVLYPNIQKKIHDELDQVMRTDDFPRRQDIKNMPYLQATLCEVMRIASPVPMTRSNTISDITLAGYRIPKGTFIMFDLSEIHHDENEWPQPEEFKPERFLDEEGKFVGWTALNGFLPFGLGRRECGGIGFAKIMLFTFTATLLHRLKFELPEAAGKPNEKPAIRQLVSSPKDFKIIARSRVK